jgi:hypothetical protein
MLTNPHPMLGTLDGVPREVGSSMHHGASWVDAGYHFKAHLQLNTQLSSQRALLSCFHIITACADPLCLTGRESLLLSSS